MNIQCVQHYAVTMTYASIYRHGNSNNMPNVLVISSHTSSCESTKTNLVSSYAISLSCPHEHYYYKTFTKTSGV